MAYAASGLSLRSQLIGGGGRVWDYASSDALAAVMATDYFALAYDHGMREGDVIDIRETDTDPPNFVRVKVNAIDADGNATVSPMPIDNGTVTLASNAGTLNRLAGRITTEALTTAAAGSQALVLTNSLVAAGDMVHVQWSGGTSTGGTPIIKAVCTASTLTITLYNKHASAAFDGTFILDYRIDKAI
jgi:hypothetical protein